MPRSVPGARDASRVTAAQRVESQLAAVLRAATGHLIITTDQDGTVLAFNAGAERILGYRAADVIGEYDVTRFIEPAELAAEARALGLDPGSDVVLGAARGGPVDKRDWTMIAADDRRVTIELSVSAMTDNDGTLLGFVGIGTDVTEARSAVASLGAQKELYRLLVDNLPDTTVALFDDQLRCVTIGGRWPNRLGGRPEEFVGWHLSEFFTDLDRPEAAEFFARGLRESVTEEWDLPTGQTFQFSAMPLSGARGEPLIFALANDITRRVEEERRRREVLADLAVSEASFREAFERAAIGMAVTIVVDGSYERFLRVNPAFANLLGRTPEELVGVAVADISHPEDVGITPDLHASEATTATLRKRFLRPSGQPVWVEVTYAVVRDKDGNASHVIKQIQDIDALKKSERSLLDALESQRAATDRLAELDRVRTELVATMSHELRTPLTSVTGYLDLLADEPLSDAQHAMLSVASRNATRLADLVDNLLVLVRLDGEASDPQRKASEVDIASAVEAAVDTVRPLLARRGQEFAVALPASKTVVLGDPDHLERALVNLLTNASKYTPDGGRIDLDVDLDPQTQCVTMSVRDTGIGIPLEEQEHLFTRFFRASSARANAIGGTGLGLAIVKSIVERHAGEISVESQPGQGSCFTIALPLAARTPLSA